MKGILQLYKKCTRRVSFNLALPFLFSSTSNFAWCDRTQGHFHFLNLYPLLTMSKFKRSDPVVSNEDNMPCVGYPSSPPPMTEEDDAYSLPGTQPPFTQSCEPDVEADGTKHSHSNDKVFPSPHSPAHLLIQHPYQEERQYHLSHSACMTPPSRFVPLDGDMDSSDDEDDDRRCHTQRPIRVEQDDPEEEEDNAVPSYDDSAIPSYDIDPYDHSGDSVLSSYDDDDDLSPSHSRSYSPTPIASTPRTPSRALGEDTGMPPSSSSRAENPVYSSSQEMSPVREGGDNPTSIAYKSKGMSLHIADVVTREDDNPPAIHSSQSIRSDYSDYRLSSPSL